jgi:hypothetical protein
MIDYEKPVGFFLSSRWMYGPLVAFLPLAAQCATLRIPFTLEEQSTGKVLAGYDGENERGEDGEIKQKVVEAGAVFLDELAMMLFFAEKKEYLAKCMADLGTAYHGEDPTQN